MSNYLLTMYNDPVNNVSLLFTCFCSDAVTDSYGRTYQDMFAQYKRLLQEDGFRIFLYYGDTDMACNFLGGEWFVDQLNLELKRARAPWYTNKGQVAGYDMVFDKDFTYTTIRVS